MLHAQLRRALFWSLTAFLLYLAACGTRDLPERLSAEQILAQQTATPAKVLETESAAEPTATQKTVAPAVGTVAASDCPWDVSGIIGQWVNERGELYEFTEGGNYYYQQGAADPATGGTWACAQAEETSIVLTAGYWRGNSQFGSETAVNIIHRIIIKGDDTLSLEKAPILTGVFDEFTRLNE